MAAGRSQDDSLAGTLRAWFDRFGPILIAVAILATIDRRRELRIERQLQRLWSHDAPILSARSKRDAFPDYRDEFETLAREMAWLRERATTDPLTGLPNRAAILARLFTDLEQATRSAEVISVLHLDIDHFKDVNDTFGHPVGDRVLKELSAILSGFATECVIGRMGGEEFFGTMVGPGGARAADAIRSAVAAHDFRGTGGPERLTISIGVVEVPAREATMEALIHQADGALYDAKTKGRDRVVVHEASTVDRRL